MRLLVELRALRHCVYDLKYHHKLQGFLYSLLIGSDYEDLHNRRGYKFFSFSNIFPPKDMRKGDVRHLLISSSDTDLISVFRDRLSKLNRADIGEMSFSVEGVSVLTPKVGRSCTLITGTPIVVRIPKANYAKYGIKPPKEYPYVYWRKQYTFNAFIKQLEDNLFKKYNLFHNTSIEPFPLLEQFIFQKQVCNHIIIRGREVRVFGSLWKFIFNNLYKEKRGIIQFGLDTGFGELNSLGFGFMSIMVEK
ncbi:MAG: CRISPR-associated endoribonuclease Cas6 [Candidatus Bathyarchaeales archaeon]